MTIEPRVGLPSAPDANGSRWSKQRSSLGAASGSAAAAAREAERRGYRRRGRRVLREHEWLCDESGGSGAEHLVTDGVRVHDVGVRAVRQLPAAPSDEGLDAEDVGGRARVRT